LSVEVRPVGDSALLAFQFDVLEVWLNAGEISSPCLAESPPVGHWGCMDKFSEHHSEVTLVAVSDLLTNSRNTSVGCCEQYLGFGNPEVV
jgi:hypothetical protein